MSDENPPEDEIIFRSKDGSESKVVVNQPEFSKGESFFLAGLAAAFVAGFGAIIWAGVKEEKRQQAEYLLRTEEKRRDKEALESWFNESENEGLKIYKLDDGRFLTVDGAATQQTHIKREVINTVRNRSEE